MLHSLTYDDTMQTFKLETAPIVKCRTYHFTRAYLYNMWNAHTLGRGFNLTNGHIILKATGTVVFFVDKDDTGGGISWDSQGQCIYDNRFGVGMFAMEKVTGLCCHWPLKDLIIPQQPGSPKLVITDPTFGVFD